ncbi:MAG: chromate transporter [Nitrospinae bacterium]|nr:chromate transporter [Nitrospinota bacterium]
MWTDFTKGRPLNDRHERDGHSPLTVFLIFLRLGLTSFGGPVAHLGYFRDEFVVHRRWLGERAYADLVALCQFLPGPASSQVGIALGLGRAGYAGAAAAWAGFTLPSAVAMILFAVGLARFGDQFPPGALHGLKIVACVVALLVPGAPGQIGVIVAAGLAGLLLFTTAETPRHEPAPIPVGRRAALASLTLFALLLTGAPLAARLADSPTLSLVDSFYRTGSLVFGGGHVALPLLQAEVVAPGRIDEATFVAGYGAAQAVPGPLFSFAAFLGAVMTGSVTGGMVALAAIFAPSFLLVIGALPFWETLRHDARMQAALCGVNAAVVGLLLAALYTPVWSGAIGTPADFGLALCAFAALLFWKLPPWLVVGITGAVGAALG